MFGLGTPELIIIFVAVMILFGAPKIPELARSLGQSIRIFRDETKIAKSDVTAKIDPNIEVTKRSM